MNGRTAARIYIRRGEEKDIRRELDAVRADHTSRAVLLYGDGGVGKTSLVRHMARRRTDDGTVWLQPVDVDDPEIWLLSSLESKVADRLDPGNHYFAEYRERRSRLPSATRADISHETIISHLNRLRGIFTRSYQNYVSTGHKTVVIVFDTIETIRGTNLARTLTQWMKALPADTLFILSGRPPAGDRDQLKSELDSRYRAIPVATVKVRGFSRPHARSYIRRSGISENLIGDEEEALVLLSRGHPLWLAFLVDYLRTEGVPPEATRYSLPEMERLLPFDGEMNTKEGERLHEDFLRRLVTPYQDADFWHEAIKRLAVVRQPVEKRVWQRLMADRTLPDSVSMDAAWKQMLKRPWIRPRANGQYLTLHDAVAEEFARRLFPLHDQDQRWRHGIWEKALGIYHRLAAEDEYKVEQIRAALDEELKRAGAARSGADAQTADLVSRSVELKARERGLDQLRAATLYYTFLTSWETGSRRLLESYDEAGNRNDSFFQDLLVLYLDRFLPGRASSESFNDVIGLKLDEFREWLTGAAGRGYYIALGIMVGRYLVDSAQAEEALEFLAGLPDQAADAPERHRLYILRGNACLRASGRVREAIEYFDRAVAHAEALDTPDRHKLSAEAYKERGFYYRNTGEWDKAERSYAHAWATLVNALSTDEDREELASIQTNWAYIKGLRGSHDEGIHLAQTAAGTRRRLKKPADEGLSLSVCGEIHRYARRYQMAWRAYADAERLLTEEGPYWDRLGFVYQEQAICLYQANRDGIAILNNTEPTAEAEWRIGRALELCLEYAIRAYPSALNRAGRIIGDRDDDAGLRYLEEGISEAQRLLDGWFWCANLVEYAELCYRRWRDDEDPRYRANIEQRSAEIDRVIADYSFPDLRGRWSLLKGHLAVHSGDVGKLDEALGYYEKGFADLATRHVGSSGQASLDAEFATFEKIFTQLPEEVKANWQARLRSAWGTAGEASMLLLAHLEELVIRPAGLGLIPARQKGVSDGICTTAAASNSVVALRYT